MGYSNSTVEKQCIQIMALLKKMWHMAIFFMNLFNMPTAKSPHNYLRVYSLHHNVLPTTINPFNDQWASLPDHTRFLLPRSAYNASTPVIISHHQFRIVVFCTNVCVCVAVAESVRSGSVAVVSSIYLRD